MDGIAEKKEDALLFTENSPLKQVTGKIKAFLDYKLLGRNHWSGAFWLPFFHCCFGCWCIYLCTCLFQFFKYFPHKLPRHQLSVFKEKLRVLPSAF